MATHADVIVSADDSDIHDEPHLQGRRVTVRAVHAAVEKRSQSPETVADELDISLADVYHALAYYRDHLARMQAIEDRRAALHDAADPDPDIATGPSDAPESP